MTLGLGHRKVSQYISLYLYFLCPKHLRSSASGYRVRSKGCCGGPSGPGNRRRYQLKTRSHPRPRWIDKSVLIFHYVHAPITQNYKKERNTTLAQIHHISNILFQPSQHTPTFSQPAKLAYLLYNSCRLSVSKWWSPGIKIGLRQIRLCLKRPMRSVTELIFSLAF